MENKDEIIQTLKDDNCDCSKSSFQKEPKKECIKCMYKELLYLVP